MLSNTYNNCTLHSPYKLTKITKANYLSRVKEDEISKHYPNKFIKFHKIC